MVKLKNIADSINTSPKSRGLNLPNYQYLFELTKNEFKKNLIFIKKIKNKPKINFFIKFLINHHSQHLETIKIILNLLNLKKYDAAEKCFSIIEAKLLFLNRCIKRIYKIGSCTKRVFKIIKNHQII